MREWIIFSFVSLIFGLSFAVYKVRAGRSVTFSEHAARHPLAYLVFALSLTCCAVLLYFHATLWLAPRLGLGMWFSLLMAIGCACIVVAGWVPATTGMRYRIHNYAAFGIIVIILLVIASVSLAPDISQTARSVELFVMATLGLLWALIHSSSSKHRESLLYYEALYFACFFTGMLAAVYL